MCVASAVSQNGLRIDYIYVRMYLLDCAIRRLRSKTGVKAYDFRKEPLSELQWPIAKLYLPASEVITMCQQVLRPFQ